MPATAIQLGVKDRCNIDQNVSGGVRYLAWLMQQFHDDFRLVVAAYYAGKDVIARRALGYRNPDVISYVTRIRTTYLREAGNRSRTTKNGSERDVR
jgi:soluble lytic murein transglycosylase-like protein